jgi:hypothetical protein
MRSSVPGGSPHAGGLRRLVGGGGRPSRPRRIWHRPRCQRALAARNQHNTKARTGVSPVGCGRPRSRRSSTHPARPQWHPPSAASPDARARGRRRGPHRRRSNRRSNRIGPIDLSLSSSCRRAAYEEGAGAPERALREARTRSRVPHRGPTTPTATGSSWAFWMQSMWKEVVEQWSRVSGSINREARAGSPRRRRTCRSGEMAKSSTAPGLPLRAPAGATVRIAPSAT